MGMCLVVGDPDPPTSFSFVASGNADSSSKLIPATAAAGDVAILLDTAFSEGGSVPATVVPTGFTSLQNDTVSGGNGGVRAIVSAKIIEAGEPNTSVAGLSGDTRSRYIIMIFRPNAVVAGFVSAANGQGTTGNPSSQTISSASSSTKPVIAWAHWYSTNPVDPRDASPSMTEISGSSSAHFGKYKIYTSSDTLANHSIDMDDEGGENTLQSGYLRFT